MADTKISGLTAISTDLVLADDLFKSSVKSGGSYLDRKVTVQQLLGRVLNHTAQGRLTLVSGTPVYAPYEQVAASTDTSADTVTLTAGHGWVTQTVVYVRETIGGLTKYTKYYVNVSTNTVSFHTTRANAAAGTSKVDLTADITQTLIPVGMANTTLYWTPFRGALMTINDGTRPVLHEFSELSLALGTLVADTLYDVFCYNNAGTLTLKLGPAWSASTVGASSRGTGAGTTELDLVHGSYHNKVSIASGPGALAGLYLGTILAIDTASVEDTTHRQGLVNVHHPVPRRLWAPGAADSWSYGTSTWRVAGGSDAQGKLWVLDPLGLGRGYWPDVGVIAAVDRAVGADRAWAIGRNSDTVPSEYHVACIDADGGHRQLSVPRLRMPLAAGLNTLTWLEYATAGESTYLKNASLYRNHTGLHGEAWG